MTIAKISARLVAKLERKRVGKDEFLSALILYFLSERKLSASEIQEKIDVLDTTYDLSTLIQILETANEIEKDGDHWKIKVT